MARKTGRIAEGIKKRVVSLFGKPWVPFPKEKRDFKGDINGDDVFSLANAFELGTIQRGDILRVTANEKVENLLYLDRDPLVPWGHHFLPKEPHENMPARVILSEIERWEKIGHRTPEEWSTMIEKIQARSA